MDVFIMIRRKKTTIFLDAKETTPVYEIQKMVEGITNIPLGHRALYIDNQEMLPNKLLKHYNITSSTAEVEAPAIIGLAFEDTDSGILEDLEIVHFSTPPELPNELKSDTE